MDFLSGKVRTLEATCRCECCVQIISSLSQLGKAKTRKRIYTTHETKTCKHEKKTCLFPRTVSYQNLQVWQQALWLGLIRPESRQLCNIVSASQSPSCTTAVCCTQKKLGPIGVFFLWNLPCKSFAITPFVDAKGSEDSGDCWMYQMVTSVPNGSRNDGGYNYWLSTVSEEICNCTTNPTSATCTPFNCSFLGFKSFMTWVNCVCTIWRKLPPNLCEVLHCTRWKRQQTPDMEGMITMNWSLLEFCGYTPLATVL